MISDAKKRADAKYDAGHTRQIKLKLNLETDKDILKRLDEVGNKQGYIKELIRDDLKSVDTLERALRNSQTTICGYSFQDLMVFADACRRQGIDEKMMHDFVFNAESAYNYIVDQMQEQFEKQIAGSETGN